jgi:short-subunit dehydrogenase
MSLPFAGQRIVITGASSGIGRELALLVAREGATVVVAGRDRARLDAVAGEIAAAGGKATTVVAELAERGAAARLIDESLAALGGLDVLVNNAGYGLSAQLADAPLDEVERLFAVNVHAVVAATQRALPALRATRGVVVNVGSVVGRRGLPTIGAYCMTKAALASYSEALRAEEAASGVHVLQVEPGMTATGFSDHRVIHGDHPRHYRSRFVMPAATAARLIARAIPRRRDRIVLGLPGWLMILANTFAPWLLNRLLASKSARTREIAP